MIPYYGDFAEDATIYMMVNTFSSDDPAASVTITNLAAGDIHVHKDGNTTQATTNGATVSIDFDTITGNHLITIDTSADAFYATGSDYQVRMEGTTVDGATINAWIGTFSIQNRYNDVNVVTVAGTSQTANDNGADINTLLTRIVGTLAAGTHNAQSGDSYARLGAPAGASVSADIATVDSNVDAILVDTAEIGTAGAGLTAVPWNASWDAEVQSECTDALNAYDPPTKTEMDAGFSALNDPTAASIADAVLDEALSGHVTAGSLGKAVADIEVDTGTTIPGTITTIDTVVDAIKAVTDNLPDSGALNDLAAILTDTGTTLPAQITALNDISVADVLTTQMTESYSTDGTAPTLAQAIFLILQYLYERSVSGTTVTIKKLDGSTTAATQTLDDGTTPTSTTRAS